VGLLRVTQSPARDDQEGRPYRAQDGHGCIVIVGIVLLVEDDQDYREIVASELSWHGFATRCFADGDALLGSLDTAVEADIIVLDWRLPTISGIDLLPQLRQRGV
jgi:FixJ family two-component response regulator